MGEPGTACRNHYWLLRHGRSLANEAEIIVSLMENGVQERWTLAPAGEEQALSAGLKLKQELSELPPGTPLFVYASPFARAKRTATIAAEQVGLDPSGPNFTLVESLRERYFGKALEMQPHAAAYGNIWEHDVVDGYFRPGGGDGESVSMVAQRVHDLYRDLEARHSGAALLLVGHGDTLSIGQATLQGVDVREHRQFSFETAELRRVHPTI